MEHLVELECNDLLNQQVDKRQSKYRFFKKDIESTGRGPEATTETIEEKIE